ncbi:NADP-dependent oxidoreductase [Micromonospora sp. WMMD708]|uniref:NADP-dependent oxidoreductase n=1 Tax=Micromonospora sp. WMMD708 TaxID=3403464 RepID=UPI003BF5CC61
MIERPVEAPGRGQVRIAVRAAGVNPLDWKLRSGKAPFIRVDFPAVPGGEVSGVVDAVGPGVTRFAVGDEVLGTTGVGGYAEQVLAPADTVATKPAGLPWDVAGGLPIASNTAAYALGELGLAAGETLLIDAAAGGVGTVAGQLALRAGANVIGTASEANHEYLRLLGIQPVAYGEGLTERIRAIAPAGVDAALDASGRGGLPTLVAAAGGPQRVLTIADPAAQQHGVRFISTGSAGAAERIAVAATLAAQGLLRLAVAGTYRLEEAVEAQRVSEQGHVRGKLVIMP